MSLFTIYKDEWCVLIKEGETTELGRIERSISGTKMPGNANQYALVFKKSKHLLARFNVVLRLGCSGETPLLT